MRIAHCTAWFLPETYGGTEIYVASLARELRAAGFDQAILAPKEKPDHPYEGSYEGIPVIRYAPGEFSRGLKSAGPDLLHLHTWTATAGLRELREAKSAAIPVVVTLHNFAPICANETLMRYDREACPGQIRDFDCAACYLHHRGLPLAFAQAAAGISTVLAGAGRPLDTQRRRAELRELEQSAAALVAPADFVREALILNGVDASHIILCRQGFSGGPAARIEKKPAAELRVGFIGRLDLLKGADIIAEAVTRLPPEAAVSLEMIGAVGGVAGTRRDPDKFMRRMRALAADSRIRLLGPLPYEKAMERLRSFDLLAVPSRWQETGPLVAMEAIALGVPVLGSALGAIPNTVRNGVHGRIISSLDPADWAEALRQILADPGLLAKWRANRDAVRTMRDVAFEMGALYKSILTSKN